MRLLIDTQALIWAVADDKRLTNTARTVLLDPDNRLFFSAAS